MPRSRRVPKAPVYRGEFGAAQAERLLWRPEMKLALVTVVVAALAAAVPATAAAPGRLQVTALEFEYRLSRPQLRSGRWSIIELVNLGQDEHNLRLRRIGGTRTYGIKTALPGQRRYLAAKLRTGRYHLWCSIADHRARGMRAQLRVLPPPSS